jgi:glycosyltransferase involved in cell wall biosynthesis
VAVHSKGQKIMILITGFPYVRKNFSETFDYYPNPEDIFFLLPRVWKVKRGKVIYKPDQKKSISTTATYFHHSHYPIVGGLLKGWMPFFPWHAGQFKKKGGSLVYACSEPNLLSTLYFNIWSRLLGLKVVNFTWENIDPRIKYTGAKGWFQMLILKFNLSLVDGVVCGNKKGKNIFQQLSHKPMAIIPMSGIDPDKFQRHDSGKEFEDYRWNDNIVFTFAGAIGYRKGIHHIVRAFSEVIIKIPNALLVIAGSGEYEKEIETEIKKLNLDHHIIRIPWLSHQQLPKLLEASDVFLYPSISYDGWEEQFGYSMAEASLMEVPVITTRSGSIDEVVLAGQTGILIEPDNADDLASAMIELGRNKELRESLGKKGREFITTNFSHKAIATKFKDFFATL